MVDGTAFLGPALAVGLAGAGAGIAIGLIGKASLEAMSRNPNMYSKLQTSMLIAIALAEAVAIYGLVMGFVILGKI